METLSSPARLMTGHLNSDTARQGKPRKSTIDTSHRTADGDFYKVAQLVGGADQALLRRVRTFAEEKVAPVINQYWGRAEFPFQLITDYEIGRAHV